MAKATIQRDTDITFLEQSLVSYQGGEAAVGGAIMDSISIGKVCSWPSSISKWLIPSKESCISSKTLEFLGFFSYSSWHFVSLHMTNLSFDFSSACAFNDTLLQVPPSNWAFCEKVWFFGSPLNRPRLNFWVTYCCCATISSGLKCLVSVPKSSHRYVYL